MVARFKGMPSTVIRRFAYDSPGKMLDVEFVSGRRYRYFAVPQEIEHALRGALSKGRFFNAHIRDVYAFRELRSAGPARP